MMIEGGGDEFRVTEGCGCADQPAVAFAAPTGRMFRQDPSLAASFG